MAVALVSAGAIATGPTSAAPLFGTPTTAGNLLILVASSSGANALSISDVSWTQAITKDGTSTHATIWYKANCGAGETAPSVTGGSATVRAMLAEFSGAAATTPLDRSVASASLSSITAAGVDATTGELMVSVDMYHYASSGACTTTDTYNNATATNLDNNDAGATGNHSRMAYGITTANSVADKNTVTQTLVGGSAPAQASLVLASFKIQPPTTKTITGKSRIQVSTSQAITGKARIQQSVLKDITGLSRITVTNLKTLTGLSRIQKATTQNLTGVSRITVVTLRNLTGLSRITISTQRNITGKADIQKTVSRNITGVARIGGGTTVAVRARARMGVGR